MVMNGCEVSFWDDENVLKLDSEGCTPTNTTKPPNYISSQGAFMCVGVNFISIKLFLKNTAVLPSDKINQMNTVSFLGYSCHLHIT